VLATRLLATAGEHVAANVARLDGAEQPYAEADARGAEAAKQDRHERGDDAANQFCILVCNEACDGSRGR
jgi:hypothetical protein